MERLSVRVIKNNVFTSPWPVIKDPAPSNKGNNMDCTSDAALSMSSKTTQRPLWIAFQTQTAGKKCMTKVA